MKYLIAGLVAAATVAAPGILPSLGIMSIVSFLPSAALGMSLTAAAAEQTFTGMITDDMCANTGHAAMRMGPTDAECAAACVSIHDAAYVLQDGKTIYKLSDQKTPAKFAGRKAKVVGALDARTRTIAVTSIAAAD
jgi:hypothetical protein